MGNHRIIEGHHVASGCQTRRKTSSRFELDRQRPLATAIALCALIPSVADAHHPVSEAGAAWVEPMAFAEASLDVASFDLGGPEVGTWQVLTGRVELPVSARLSFSGAVPLAYIQFDDGRGAVGLSDVELSSKFLVYASQHGTLIISAGLGTALPTGEPNDGLGAGHFETMAYAMISTQLTRKLNLYGNAAYKHALGDSTVASAALLAHDTTEFDLIQGAQWFWKPTFWTELTSREVLSWQGDWGNLWEIGARIGLKFASSARVSLSASVPISGTDRTKFRSNLSLAWMY